MAEQIKDAAAEAIARAEDSVKSYARAVKEAQEKLKAQTQEEENEY